MLEREPRRFASRDELERFLRRQLWIAGDGEKDALFRAALDEFAVVAPDGTVVLAGQQALPIGVVTWQPVARAVGKPASRR